MEASSMTRPLAEYMNVHRKNLHVYVSKYVFAIEMCQ